MTGDADPSLAALLRRATAAAERADAAATRARVAEQREAHATLDQGSVFLDVAARHRSAERRHRATAALYHSLVQTRLQSLERSASGGADLDLATAAARMLGAPSLTYVLVDHDRHPVRSQATDPIARAAENLELVYGEGPMHDAIDAGRDVTASVPAGAGRWVHYGRPLGDLGVRRVRAAPLLCGDLRFGAVCVFDPPGSLELRRVADAMTDVLLDDAQAVRYLHTGDTWSDWSTETGSGVVLRGSDEMTELHQAAGMVVASVGCDPSTAITLIRARAYADDLPAVAVAHAILAGELRLSL